MDPLGTNVYLFKSYHPNDSFCTFFPSVVSPTTHKLTKSSTYITFWNMSSKKGKDSKLKKTAKLKTVRYWWSWQAALLVFLGRTGKRFGLLCIWASKTDSQMRAKHIYQRFIWHWLLSEGCPLHLRVKKWAGSWRSKAVSYCQPT